MIESTEVGTQILLVEEAPLDKKMVVETMAEALTYAYEGYNPYIKELGNFYFFTKGLLPNEFIPKPGITAEAVDAMIAALIGGSPAALDTLKELADAVSSNPNFGTDTVTHLNTIDGQISQILSVIAVAPTYIAPTSTITANTQTVEKGSTLNLTLNMGFNKNDAGNSTGFTLLRNGSVLSNLQNNAQIESNIQAVITFQGQVSYSEGAIKNNNLGIADPTGHILAGSVNSPIQTITPKSKIFYGNLSALPTTSAQVRALASVFDGTTQIDLSTGTVNKVFIVAVPQNRSITSATDITNLNLPITDQYALIDGAFTVNDAGGNSQSCKLYAMQPAIPYSSNAIHRIIIA
jgi:hypothetical protein